MKMEINRKPQFLLWIKHSERPNTQRWVGMGTPLLSNVEDGIIATYSNWISRIIYIKKPLNLIKSSTNECTVEQN
ncbi:hypothetical protein CHUAL_005820 [Chamberlinius hualienensis]